MQGLGVPQSLETITVPQQRHRKGGDLCPGLLSHPSRKSKHASAKLRRTDRLGEVVVAVIEELALSTVDENADRSLRSLVPGLQCQSSRSQCLLGKE